MASQGKEPTFCMGDDTPLAVLSNKPRLLYDYFKQRFAQVTNPPIDPLRENLVMSLAMFLGERGNLLEPKAESARMIKLRSPLVNELELEAIKTGQLQTAELSTLYDLDGVNSLETALDNLVKTAIAGGVVSFPTDTVPALAVIPDNSAFIYQLKQREINKPLILMGAKIADIYPYLKGSPEEKAIWQGIMEKYWPGALTLVLPASEELPPAINPRQDRTIGVRIPNLAIALEI
jgi:hypothetical protein